MADFGGCVTGRTEIFNRPGTSGWIVLSGGVPSIGDDTPHLAEHVLEKANLALPPLCITASRPLNDRLRDFIEDFGLLLGDTIEIAYLDELPEAEIGEILDAAGISILAGGPASVWMNKIEQSSLHSSPEKLFLNERLIMAIGQAAAAMGTWTLQPEDGELLEGLGWLRGALIIPEIGEAMEMERVMGLLSSEEYVYSLGLPEGSVLAFGPAGEVEVWGEPKPVITLGRKWSEA
jgi:hypothetical protein